MTWEEYTRKTRKWRQGLAAYGAIIPKDIYCIVLLKSSSLESNMKVQSESMARSESADGGTLTGENVEEVLTIFSNKRDDKQDVSVAFLKET